LNKPFDNNTNTIMWGLSMTIAEKTPNHFATICHVGILIHKKPRLGMNYEAHPLDQTQ
jgi:hypothetical protein